MINLSNNEKDSFSDLLPDLGRVNNIPVVGPIIRVSLAPVGILACIASNQGDIVIEHLESATKNLLNNIKQRNTPPSE